MDNWLYDLVVGGLDLILLIQSYRTPFFNGFFKFITFFGNEEAYLLLLPLFYLTLNKQIGQRLAYLLVLSNMVNVFLKNLLSLPRPFQVGDQAINLVEQAGYGVPSGHSQTSVIIFGYLGWRERHQSVWLLPFIIVFCLLIGFSRLYLAVHFPIDVVVGFTLGIIILLLILKFESSILTWLRQTDDKLILALGIIVPIVLFFLNPSDDHGYPARDAASTYGLLLGINIGLFYETRYVQFKLHHSWIQAIIRYLLSLFVVALFWQGLKPIFAMVHAGYLVEMILRFIRYALASCALAWWTPALFIRLGLLQQEEGV